MSLSSLLFKHYLLHPVSFLFGGCFSTPSVYLDRFYKEFFYNSFISILFRGGVFSLDTYLVAPLRLANSFKTFDAEGEVEGTRLYLYTSILVLSTIAANLVCDLSILSTAAALFLVKYF